VYGSGDIVTYPGKVKLIATGFGEAATAVNNAARTSTPKRASSRPQQLAGRARQVQGAGRNVSPVANEFLAWRDRTSL